MSSYNPILVYSPEDIMRIADGDHEIWAASNQRCLDAGGCPECLCVAAEQGREHWSHCSKAAKLLVADGEADPVEKRAA